MTEPVQFDAVRHIYAVNGRRVPSVTGVLRAIDNFAFVPAELLQRAREFGSHCHLATHFFDRGELDEPSLDPGLAPYLEGYKQFLYDTKFVVTHSEERVYNEKLRYAGTLDKRGIWKKTTWLLDLKSGAVPRSVGPQTAGYQEACHERPRRRLCLQLKPNAYKLIPCQDTTDFSIFISCLNIANFLNKGEHDVSDRTSANDAYA